MNAKQRIQQEFKVEMEKIYNFCTNLDSDGKLMEEVYSVEPETVMERMANDALDRILEKYL